MNFNDKGEFTMTIYELQGEYKRLYDMADECELELEDIKDTLESLDGEFADKAVGYGKIMKEIEGQIATLKAEEERLANRRRSLENNKDRMKTVLQLAMIETGNEKIKTDLFSFNIQNNPATVNIAPDAKIPEKYYIAQEPKLDKKQLIKDVKEGTEIEGVELFQTRGLRIR